MLCLSSIINTSFEVGIYDEVKPVSLVIFFFSHIASVQIKNEKRQKIGFNQGWSSASSVTCERGWEVMVQAKRCFK